MTPLSLEITQNIAHADISKRFVFTSTAIGEPQDNTEAIVARETVTTNATVVSGILLFASIQFSIGTAGTGYEVRIYRGASSGSPIIDSGLTPATAAKPYSPVLLGVDTAPVLPNQLYTLTLQVAGASAVSTVVGVTLLAVVV